MTPREAQDGADGAQVGSAVHGEGSGAPAGSQGVTDEDRERAMFLLFPELAYRMPSYIAGLTFSEESELSMAGVAAALAEERAKARAPFLIRARECELQADVYDRLDKPKTARAFRVCAQRIRRAAEVTE